MQVFCINFLVNLLDFLFRSANSCGILGMLSFIIIIGSFGCVIGFFVRGLVEQYFA